MKTTQTDSNEDFLDDFFDESSVVTNSDLEELGEAITELKKSPRFQADALKDDFIHTLLEAMDEVQLNANQLANRWGKSRQYVSKLIKADKSKNFTIDTLVEAMDVLGRRVEIFYPKHGVVTHVLHCLRAETVKPKFDQTCSSGSVANVVEGYREFSSETYVEVKEDELLTA